MKIEVKAIEWGHVFDYIREKKEYGSKVIETTVRLNLGIVQLLLEWIRFLFLNIGVLT